MQPGILLVELRVFLVRAVAVNDELGRVRVGVRVGVRVRVRVRMRRRR